MAVSAGVDNLTFLSNKALKSSSKTTPWLSFDLSKLVVIKFMTSWNSIVSWSANFFSNTFSTPPDFSLKSYHDESLPCRSLYIHLGFGLEMKILKCIKGRYDWNNCRKAKKGIGAMFSFFKGKREMKNSKNQQGNSPTESTDKSPNNIDTSLSMNVEIIKKDSKRLISGHLRWTGRRSLHTEAEQNVQSSRN